MWQSASFTTAAGETIEVEHTSNDLKLHTFTLTFASALPVGKQAPCCVGRRGGLGLREDISVSYLFQRACLAHL